MSSESDDESDVQLYNSLERNLKRQRKFVSLSSSESEGDSDDDGAYDDGRSVSSAASPFKKRLRGSAGTTTSPARGAAPGAACTVVLDDDEVEHVDDLLTAKERERERERERRLEIEIAERMSKDTLLNQTRAIMSKVKDQMATESSTSGIIAVDSDEDDAVLIVPPNGQASSSQSKPPASSSTAASIPAANSGGASPRGDRITLQVRSNGTRTDELVMFSQEPFSVLYDRFCSLHGLPRSAVQLSLDGDSLKLTDTPAKADLESGDLIDAKVDFSKADDEKKKRVVRLLLAVDGRKPEKFRIDVTTTLEKLHLGFCKRHQIVDPDDVEMTIRGDRLRLSETVEAHELFDDDVINVEIKNYVDPTSIELNVRYDGETARPHTVVPSHKVDSLIAQIAQHLSVDASRISLWLDGESMLPRQTLQHYDLEGGEIIEVKVQS